jgi:hypothetical protein
VPVGVQVQSWFASQAVLQQSLQLPSVVVVAVPAGVHAPGAGQLAPVSSCGLLVCLGWSFASSLYVKRFWLQRSTEANLKSIQSVSCATPERLAFRLSLISPLVLPHGVCDPSITSSGPRPTEGPMPASNSPTKALRLALQLKPQLSWLEKLRVG